MKNTNNRSRRLARRISEVMQKTKSHDMRLQVLQDDPELTAEQRTAAINAVMNIKATLAVDLHALQKRQAELPPLPVVPTNMTSFKREPLFATEDLEGRHRLMSRNIKCSRAFYAVGASR